MKAIRVQQQKQRAAAAQLVRHDAKFWHPAELKILKYNGQQHIAFSFANAGGPAWVGARAGQRTPAPPLSPPGRPVAVPVQLQSPSRAAQRGTEHDTPHPRQCTVHCTFDRALSAKTGMPAWEAVASRA